jgi:hypothetical protein
LLELKKKQWPSARLIHHNNDFVLSGRDEILKAMLSSKDFSPFDLDVSDLIQCVYLIFEQVLALPELSSYKITKGKRNKDFEVK